VLSSSSESHEMLEAEAILKQKEPVSLLLSLQRDASEI